MSVQTPEPTFDGVEEALRAAHQEGVVDLYEILARMLTSAGAMSEWDSETIETVLLHAEPATGSGTALPWVGNTGADGEAHLFWARVAQSAGWEHDWAPQCPECHDLLENDDAVAAHTATAHPDPDDRPATTGSHLVRVSRTRNALSHSASPDEETHREGDWYIPDGPRPIIVTFTDSATRKTLSRETWHHGQVLQLVSDRLDHLAVHEPAKVRSRALTLAVYDTVEADLDAVTSIKERLSWNVLVDQVLTDAVNHDDGGATVTTQWSALARTS